MYHHLKKIIILWVIGSNLWAHSPSPSQKDTQSDNSKKKILINSALGVGISILAASFLKKHIQEQDLKKKLIENISKISKEINHTNKNPYNDYSIQQLLEEKELFEGKKEVLKGKIISELEETYEINLTEELYNALGSIPYDHLKDIKSFIDQKKITPKKNIKDYFKALREFIAEKNPSEGIDLIKKEILSGLKGRWQSSKGDLLKKMDDLSYPLLKELQSEVETFLIGEVHNIDYTEKYYNAVKNALDNLISNIKNEKNNEIKNETNQIINKKDIKEEILSGLEGTYQNLKKPLTSKMDKMSDESLKKIKSDVKKIEKTNKKGIQLLDAIEYSEKIKEIINKEFEKYNE